MFQGVVFYSEKHVQLHNLEDFVNLRNDVAQRQPTARDVELLVQGDESPLLNSESLAIKLEVLE